MNIKKIGEIMKDKDGDNKMLDQDQAKTIEDNHNVYVDAKTMQFNRTGYDETYGWEPIPNNWVENYL